MNILSENDIKAYKACRAEVAFSIPKGMSLIRVTGEDHLQFIQGQSTNDIISLENGQGQTTAFLTPKAKIRSLATVFRCKDSLYLLVPETTCDSLMTHLDMYTVMEDVELEKLEYELLAVSGPGAREFLETTLGCQITPRDIYDHQQLEWNDRQLPLSLINLYGESSFLFFVKGAEILCNEWNQNNFPILSEKVQKILRTEAGLPLFPDDIDENTLFPETGLQTEYVSYTKGCFVGQEIVARVKYRGSVNRSLMGIIYEDEVPELKGEFFVRGQKGGRITTTVYSPFLDKYISFAYVNKKFRAPDQRINLEIAESSLKSRVVLLPFYIRQSELNDAMDLYHQAVEVFSESNNSNDITVEKLLRKAILKNPNMADAYEALGVVLSRQERYDEAIELMKQLKQINPEEVMAYSNLSLYYMKKGMIQEAEDEKAAATAAGFKKAAKERKERIEEENLLKKQESEAYRKIDMFKQVLEIDQEDLIANFGMGKALIDTARPQEAIAYLEKCLAVKKDYSAAYLQLGIACMKSGYTDKARIIFKDGVNCALSNGDLMPKNEMEHFLSELDSDRTA